MIKVYCYGIFADTMTDEEFYEVEKNGYLEKMVVFDLSSRFKSKSTLFLLVVFCSITGILY